MDIQVTAGNSYVCSFTREYVLELWCKHTGSEPERCKKVLETLLEALPDSENVDISELKSRVVYIIHQIQKYWKESCRIREKVVSKRPEWFTTREVVTLPRCSASSHPSTSASRVGRPLKDFQQCSSRSQRRRLTELAKVDESAVKSLLETSDRSNSSMNDIDCDDVLSLITEAKLTKHQYLLIRDFVNSRSNSVFPSYQKVLKAKKRCYPEKVSVSESSAEVELQSLLDHTTTRILDSQKEVLSSIDCESLGDVFLVGKWGFDGSTGHSEYKQAFEDPNLKDDSLFVTSFVPLRLVSVVSTTSEETILWKNPRPSSTRYCRPIRFQFAKESKELTKQEKSYFLEKIDNLVPTKYTFDDKEINVVHSLQLTMVDGKVCTALDENETSPSSCYLCGSLPKGMNDIDLSLERSVNHDNLEFGLSPLHAWIRFFEYFIHVSYKINIKKWQARSEDDKAEVLSRKKLIQSEFRQKLGLRVDHPRSGGSGTSNDGNTARKFFKNSSVSAEITGIPQILIERCGAILESLSSGHKINVDKFQEFSLETARLLVKEFPWYYLPASVHKVLIHGATIVQHALLPIGELSEEAAESSNKNLKSFRREHTRKMSRATTNLDLLNRLLLHSDPYITNSRNLPRKKKTCLSRMALTLLTD